jgi:hypothetical protein
MHLSVEPECTAGSLHTLRQGVPAGSCLCCVLLHGEVLYWPGYMLAHTHMTTPETTRQAAAGGQACQVGARINQHKRSQDGATACWPARVKDGNTPAHTRTPSTHPAEPLPIATLKWSLCLLPGKGWAHPGFEAVRGQQVAARLMSPAVVVLVVTH